MCFPIAAWKNVLVEHAVRCIFVLIVWVLAGCTHPPVGPEFTHLEYASTPKQTNIYIYSQGVHWKSEWSWILAVNGTPEAVISIGSYYLIKTQPREIKLSAKRMHHPNYISPLPDDLISIVLHGASAAEAADINANESFQDILTLNAVGGNAYFIRLTPEFRFGELPSALFEAVAEEIAIQELEGLRLAEKPMP